MSVGKKNNPLNQRERFRIWSMAVSLNPKENPVSLYHLVSQFKNETGVLLVNVKKGYLSVERCSTVMASFSGEIYLLMTRPDKNASHEVWRSWISQIAEDMYRCMVARHKDGHIDFEILSRPCDVEATYFAKVFLTQWNGTVSPLVSLPGKTGEDELGLLYAPEKLLESVRKLPSMRILLLGSYSITGGKRLDLLQSMIDKKGLTPIIFGDLYGSSDAVVEGKIREAVLAVAKFCELVIVEDSEPSGHLYELEDLSKARVKTAILRQYGQGSTILAEPFWQKNPSFMRLFKYNAHDLNKAVDDIFRWYDKLESTN